MTDYLANVGDLCETVNIHTNIIDSEPVVSKKYAVFKSIVAWKLEPLELLQLAFHGK